MKRFFRRFGFSAFTITGGFLAVTACEKAPEKPPVDSVSYIEYALLVQKGMTTAALAESVCSRDCAAKSSYWNGYWTPTQPFVAQGGLCECIVGADPYPNYGPTVFLLQPNDILGTYGDLQQLKDQSSLRLDSRETRAENGGAGGSDNGADGNGDIFQPKAVKVVKSETQQEIEAIRAQIPAPRTPALTRAEEIQAKFDRMEASVNAKIDRAEAASEAREKARAAAASAGAGAGASQAAQPMLRAKVPDSTKASAVKSQQN